MNLYELLTGVDVISTVTKELLNTDIKGIKTDISKVTNNDIFVCIKGSKFDSHTLVLNALSRGAKVIITNYNLNIVNQVVVLNTRLAYAIMCQNYFNNSAKNINLIGVTGTNGKTSTSFIIYYVLKQLGYKSGLIGTTANIIDEELEKTNLTTPDAYTLNKLFSTMVERDIKNVVMEVSSHALDQDRVGNIRYKVGVFTNLTIEHLDYHNNMEQYFLAKKKLFSLCDIVVINIDDEYGKRLLGLDKISTATYSTKHRYADFFADNITLTKDCSIFTLAHKMQTFNVRFAIPGLYSVYNVLAAITALYSLGFDLQNIVDKLDTITGITGRCETVHSDEKITVIRDYAHTPDGLKNILLGVKSYTLGRVVVLFGCGGNRDKSKRKLMAECALKYADFSIITSDNPRNENPEDIINDILEGTIDYDSDRYITIIDREKAINYALDTAIENDIIILAGKGHEDYQVINNVKYHFDEKEIVNKKLANI